MLPASRSRFVRFRWDAFQSNKGQDRPSLVGKDQLIRSRLSQTLLAISMSRTVLRAVWTYKISLRFPIVFSNFPTEHARSCETVSYTHLRAHETPEHLVCRL